MTLTAAIAVVLVVVAFLVMFDRLIALYADERAVWAREREWLLQRIQAPAQAVAMFDPTPTDPDDDEEEESPVIHDEQDEILAQLKGLPPLQEIN